MTIDTWSEGDDGDVGFLCKDSTLQCRAPSDFGLEKKIKLP